MLISLGVLLPNKGKPVTYGIGNYIFSFVDNRTEDVGMHVVAGKTGSSDEAAFASFMKTLVERSNIHAGKYFSDPRSLHRLKGYLRDFRSSKLKDTKARHFAYAIGVLLYNYPVITIAAGIVSLSVLALLIRLALLR